MFFWGSVIICNDKAFISVEGKTDSGLYVDMEPVFVSNVSIEEIKSNLAKVQAFGHPRVQILSSEDRNMAAKVMLKATGAKSWKELGRTGFCYTFSGNESYIFLQISRLDKKGRWEYDPEKEHTFPLDTPLDEVIQIIIDDYHSR